MLKDEVVKAPAAPGVYIFMADRRPLYIGKATNIRARMMSHLASAKLDAKERQIVDQSDRIKTFPTDSDFRALLLEAKLIAKFLPKYNVLGRDDKSSLYLTINFGESYPKLAVVRKPAIKKKRFWGPFSSQKLAFELVRQLRKIIPFCTQAAIGKNACFYSKIGLCSPCPNSIAAVTDEALKKKLAGQYRRNMRQIAKILDGKTESVLAGLHRRLKMAIEKDEYESGIKLRNQIFRLQYLVSRKTFGFDESYTLDRYRSIKDSLLDIVKKDYPQIRKIVRIEAVDISNIGNDQAVGSVVTYISGIPSKKDYRRFKIRGKTTSDLVRLADVIERRFKNDWPRPDIVIIDGGKLQVKTAAGVFARLKINIPLIGIVKNPDRLVTGTNSLVIRRYPLNHPGFNLIRAIRDEAHRFAKKYHLFLRNRL